MITKEKEHNRINVTCKPVKEILIDLNRFSTYHN